MRNCLKCQDEIPWKTVVDGKIKSLRNRKFCLLCSPFGSHNTRDVRTPKPTKSEKGRVAVKKFRKKKKLQCIDYKGGSCQICNYNRCPAALEFHHVDPSQKEFSISMVGAWGFDKIKAELDKCVLLCRNCHTEIHHGMVRLDGVAPST